MLTTIRKKTQVLPTTTNVFKGEQQPFSKSLYKNSNLLRIVLHKPIKENICLNKWYRIDVKLVTEMGLLMDQHALPIKLSCNVLYNNQFSNQYNIQTRPIQASAWDAEEIVQSEEGFDTHQSIGGIEYKITTQANNNEPFYITMTTKQEERILPLTVGPIYINTNDEDMNINWSNTEEKINELEKQQYRTLKSSLSDSTYFLLKEQWDFGTPGKIWDSAIVMTQILLDLFAADSNHFSNKRILDLSAGTGYIGLSIAQYYQHRKEKSPKITLTDLEEALDLIDQNKQLNGLKISNDLKIRSLMWGDKKEAKLLTEDGPLDIIIASDLLYNVAHFPSLISTLIDLCDKNTIVYLCYKQRGLTPQEEYSFFEQCGRYFMITQIEQIHNQKIQTSFTAVRIYKLQLYTLPFWSHLLLKMSG